jgi:hypothetical protein
MSRVDFDATVPALRFFSYRARMVVAGRVGEWQERNVFIAHAKVDHARFIADSSRSAHGDDVTIIDLPALDAGELTNCRCTLFILAVELGFGRSVDR